MRRHTQIQQLLKVWRSHTSDRIPALRRIPRRVRDDWCWQTAVHILTRTSCRSTIHNIIKPLVSNLIYPRVQESQRRQTLAHSRSRQQRNNGREERSRSTRSSHQNVLLDIRTKLIDHVEAVRLCRDIRKALSVRIVKTLPAISELREVPADRGVLVRWAREEVGKTAGGEVDGALGGDADGAAYGSYPRAGLKTSS